MVCRWFEKLLFIYGYLLYDMPYNDVKMPWSMKIKILKTILNKLNTVKLNNEYQEIKVNIQLRPIDERSDLGTS